MPASHRRHATRRSDRLRESLGHVFAEVPDLGGFFTIAMSENHTNCFSHGVAWSDRDPVAAAFPRCSQRSAAEVITEFLDAIRDGVRARTVPTQRSWLTIEAGARP